MKYELLKRTAIALFVGGVISSYTLAAEQPATSPNNKLTDSFNNIEAAINKNDKNIKNITKLLVGDKNDEANPGLISTIDTINKQATDNANLLIKMAGKVDQNKKDTDAEIAKKADQSAVDDINAELDARAKALETLQKEKASVKDLTDISENVKAGFDSIQDKVHNLQEALAGDGTDEKPGLIKSVSSAVEELNDNIAQKADKATVEQNTKEIEKIKNLQGYDSLTKVEALVSGKADKQALEDLKKEVKDNEEGIGELSKTVSDIDDNVVKLTDAHNELLKEHNNLVEDVKGFNDAYNKFTDATNTELDKKADIDDVEDALSRKANASDVYTKTESDSKLDVKADKTELAIKADKTELAAKADKTELANKADKNSVYSKSETDNKFALKADNSVVSAQAADINNLRTDVNTHTKRLDHLDNRVNKLDKDLKRGLAAQAALTGLFQPYTVGKANFTAAVGGYKSQTAVAIGTGYRYNQNIATKAGVAFTQGGGVTYNAGVNFEW
ncbi:YadA C-terminal domain-containing protein [Haemophilus haemolyticus]|uniref:YadA C-terminal domain-containing protein n=1 Tax=Haemophilus haemolyticus TaxID=726 RepID=UPI001A48A6BB|nr:YadA C-terminal domain-containing protein [Haemophilus haemolyticus]VTX81432.1 Adhesin YadA [Haemophilus haemolyticus]